MKFQSLLFVTLCLFASHTSFAQDVQSPPNVGELYTYLRAKSREVGVPPNPPFDVLFFDINHDGIPEALGSILENQSGGGCHGGNHWSVYRFKDGEWQWVPTRKAEDPFDTSNEIFARGNEFYSLTREGEKPKLVFIYAWQNNEDEGIRFTRDAFEVAIDDEGFRKTIPIPELTTEEVVPWKEIENESYLSRKPPKRDYKLVPLPVEMHYPQEEDGQEEWLTTKTLREAHERLAAEMKEGRTKLTNEKTGIESKTKHLWLYAGILLGVCVAVYFVRRKLKTRN